MKGKKLLKVLIVQRAIMIKKKKKKKREKEQLRSLENLQKENSDLNN